jgi:predicted GIY-YIG superfamily endonuclease
MIPAALQDELDARPHFVYRLFNSDDELIYVGCASDVEERLNSGLHPYAGLKRRVVVEEHPDKATARAAERAAIKDEAPLLNKHHNPKRFKAGARGGFTAVDPIHPLTQWMLDLNRPVTPDEQRDAIAKAWAHITAARPA